MMIIKISILILTILFFSAFSTEKELDTPELFGIAFFENAISKNLEGLKDIRITKKEIENIISSSNLSSEKKLKITQMFLETFSDDELVNNISTGLKSFINNIKQTKGKLKDVSFVKVIDETRKLDNLPFTMGNINIEYTSNNKKGIITIEALKTEHGWRIFDDVFNTIDE